MDILARICWAMVEWSQDCEDRPEVVRSRGMPGKKQAMGRRDRGWGWQSRCGEIDATEVECR